MLNFSLLYFINSNFSKYKSCIFFENISEIKNINSSKLLEEIKKENSDKYKDQLSTKNGLSKYWKEPMAWH